MQERVIHTPPLERFEVEKTYNSPESVAYAVQTDSGFRSLFPIVVANVNRYFSHWHRATPPPTPWNLRRSRGKLLLSQETSSPRAQSISLFNSSNPSVLFP